MPAKSITALKFTAATTIVLIRPADLVNIYMCNTRPGNSRNGERPIILLVGSNYRVHRVAINEIGTSSGFGGDDNESGFPPMVSGGNVFEKNPTEPELSGATVGLLKVVPPSNR